MCPISGPFSSSIMKISIITVCFNSAATLGETIASVLGQTHPAIEYIIIDGASTDGTLSIIEPHREKLAAFVSEPDSGIYDAMNKGLQRATGEVVGILNSDDIFAHSGVLAAVAAAFAESDVEVVFGDLQYISASDPERILRHWQTGAYAPGKFRRGWHPPHPAFFARRSLYQRYGGFETRLRIAADFEIMLRLLEREGATSTYLPEVLVKMRAGGASNRSLGNIARANLECWQAWRMNGLPVSPLALARKPLSKIGQLWHARRQRRPRV